MVLIFLSGEPVNRGGQLYVKNILNTLFLPSGSFNRYRYSIAGQHVNVDPDTVQYLGSWRRRLKTQVLLLFVDRYRANDYDYVPLRYGTLKKFRVEGSQSFLTVKLGDYVTADSVTAGQFLQEYAGGTGFPRLTNGDPNNPDDGNYVVRSRAKMRELSAWTTGVLAWEGAVDRLSSAHRFQVPAGKSFIFLRSTVKKKSGGQMTPRWCGRIRTRLDHAFWLSIAHRWSFVLPIPNLKLKLTTDKGTTVNPDSIEISNQADIQEIRVRTAKYSDDWQLSIKLESAAVANEAPLFPDRPLLFRLGMSVPRQLKIASLLLFIGTATVIAATNYDSSTPFVLRDFVATIPWLKVVCEVAKLAGMIGLFMLFGKKLT
jgi:hypothetical protein